jgi:hypothetical protein
MIHNVSLHFKNGMSVKLRSNMVSRKHAKVALQYWVNAYFNELEWSRMMIQTRKIPNMGQLRQELPVCRGEG